jgi:membrane protease YdiL (CAAX protease family)
VKREPSAARPLVLAASAAVPAALFIALFHFRRLGPVDFWWWMGLNIILAVGLGLTADSGYGQRLKADLRSGLPRKLILGVLSAAVLYAAFAAGRLIALKLFPFAPAGIAAVYRLKEGTGTLRILLLLGLLVGPGEEVYWRGFLQDRTSALLGSAKGFWLTALLYALVHVASGNAMLVLAAGVCGLFWGLTYRIFRSPILNAVSHTLWDLAVFVIWPL